MSPQTATAPAAAVHDVLTVHTLDSSLRAALDQPHRARLAADLAQVAEGGTTALDAHFPSAGRRYGRYPLPGWSGWAVEDAVRAALLRALPATGSALAEETVLRYSQGDAAERRGILRALPFLNLGGLALPLVEDALRTHDNRLIEAALGPYSRVHLDQPQWRQAVLKCLFTGVPLSRVAGLRERRDEELARLAAGFAEERGAAGRPVPADLWLIATTGG